MPLQESRNRPGRGLYDARRPDFAQIVYRVSAPRRRTSHVGSAIARAARANVSGDDWQDQRTRRDYYGERGIDITARDKAAEEAATPETAKPERLERAEIGARKLLRQDDDSERDQQTRATVVKAFNRIGHAALPDDQYAEALEWVSEQVQKRMKMSLPDGFRYDLEMALVALGRLNGWKLPDEWLDRQLPPWVER